MFKIAMPALPYIIAFFLALNALTCIWAYSKGKDAAEIRYIKQTVTVMEKRNEIARNRPDTKSFFDGLLKDKNW